MRIRALFSTIIDLLYDDDLFAGLTALEEDCNLGVSINGMVKRQNRNGYFSGLVDSRKG